MNTAGRFKTMAFNLESEQVRQLRALYQLTSLSYSDMAREAFREYLAKRLSAPQITSMPSSNGQER